MSTQVFSSWAIELNWSYWTVNSSLISVWFKKKKKKNSNIFQFQSQIRLIWIWVQTGPETDMVSLLYQGIENPTKY